MTPVEDLLKEKNIPFKYSGRDVLIRCLNPEHEDRNPSMRVDKILGIFNCFSCGYKGSLFKYYDVEVSAVSLKIEKLKRKLNDLRTSGVGLKMPEGYMPFKKDYRGISAATYADFDAFYHYGPDFTGRINFPIKDSSGRIVAFQGRDESGTLKDKYRTTPVGVKLPLFPVPTPIQGRVILVEGIFDVLNLYDKGLQNAVCCFGVANFNEHKLNMLKISGVTGLDLLFDPDDAGELAIKRVEKVAGNFPVRKIRLKSGDAGDLSQKQVTALRQKIYG